ncbi:MAG: hypothetical protein A2Y38_15895 [Spirochaetes bacterium GWB1_59_5]|nr:MAG: hypothetical protein A2Y38_15895 [Spirochaetes bacterium GWB1_59_5]
MTRAEVLAELRELVSDTVAPYAWSDARLMNFLSLGQTQFCKDTGFFRDTVNYKLTTEEGVSTYLLDSAIIQVLSLTNGEATITEDVRSSLFDTPSQPFAYRTDLDNRSLTLLAPADAVYILDMSVWRAARVAFNHKTGASYDGVLEIPEDFHLAPVEYAAYKCFSDHDRERQDPVKAADHLKNFKRYTIEGKRAFRRFAGSRGFQPNPIYLV